MEKVTVRYKGASPMGTLNPRRMWRPGDKLQVAPDVAEELLKQRGFVKVRVRKPKRKKAAKKKAKKADKAPETKPDGAPEPPAKDDPPQEKDEVPPGGEPEEVTKSASAKPPEE